jgi:putative oxidoreductase
MLLKYSVYFLPSFVFLFWAVTFLESAYSKISDVSGNIGYFKSVFEKTFIKDIVVPSFWILTLLELASGLGSLISLVILFIDAKSCVEVGLVSIGLSGLTLLMLFAGQRIAKDYAGAAGIVPYIIVCAISMFAVFGR